MIKINNIEKYNTSRIDITRVMFSDDFTLSNYLNDRKVVELMSVGVPCGAIQTVYKGKELSHSEEHRLNDKQLEQVRQVYVPINTLEGLAEHRATHFCSYMINPNYIEPKKVQSFIYRFDLLIDVGMRMFDLDEINKHQIELINNAPLTYEKLEIMKNKYITQELELKFMKDNKVSKDRFYELLNQNGCKGLDNILLKEFDKKNTASDEDEFEF